MSHGHFLRALKEYGVVGTFKKLYKMRTIKFGTLIGTDQFGNRYFENTKDYPYGQHRWVEYSGEKSFYEVDASVIPAEWHGWIHHVTADPPTEVRKGLPCSSRPLICFSTSLPGFVVRRREQAQCTSTSPWRLHTAPRPHTSETWAAS